MKKEKEVNLGLRKFIKDFGYLSGGTAILATTPWLQSFTPEKKEEIKNSVARIGIIGTGSRGLYHIHNLLRLKNAEIVALCDNYEPNLTVAKELCPAAKTYKDYRSLLDSKEVDGVLICTPLNWHAPIILDSLKAGKHTFCEKAMALTLQECKAIYEAYLNTDKVLFFGMQRLFDEKYIKALHMIHSGLIGDVVGMRCHWFRNHNWRRPVPDPSFEKQINWRLYQESSGGLMTELASHQLEVSNWAIKRIPDYVLGAGDIVFWKDGREVFDSISLTYHYQNGVKCTYESLIANKFNGMGEQILGHKGTMELAKGEYYFEEPQPAPGIIQLLSDLQGKVIPNIPIAGASWKSEVSGIQKPHNVIPGNVNINSGTSMIGADKDGSEELVEAFCQAVITGEKFKNIVEEAYYSTVLCLMGNEAMEKQCKVFFPEEYKIPYMDY